MKRNCLAWSSVGLLLLTVACDSPADRAEAPGAAEDRVSEAADAHAPAEHGEGQALLPIMQHLGSQMNALTYALMTDDTATVASSAAAIAEHVPIAPEELERIHRVLGTAMTEFEALDASVHSAAVQLAEAADSGRTDAVLDRLGEVQRGCVACHAQFRERLRADREASSGG